MKLRTAARLGLPLFLALASAACSTDYDAEDDDGDGLFNFAERDFRTDPKDPDTDGDGVWDGEELFVFDTNPSDPGTRPGMLTDYDGFGFRIDNGWIDVTPHPSPDGRYVIWASNRHAGGTNQLRLYTMSINGPGKRQLTYANAAPASDELDSDPMWAAGDRIVFKRERIGSGASSSRLYTATLDRARWRLENVTPRTAPTDGTLDFFPPGDYDPQLSPDGNWIASYRHLADAPGPFGDWDVFVARTSDPAQPADASLTFLLPDVTIADFFPRWSAAGSRLALWSVDSTVAVGDATDVLVFDLDLAGATPAVTAVHNVTAGDGWSESMPSWSTDPATPDKLYFSASR